MSNARRMLVLGLDGATWDLFEPLFARGYLPNLARLREHGAWGTLRATFPPVTAPSWTSCATGVNPGRHGIFDFFELVPGQYAKRLVNLERCAASPIWQLVEEAGGRAVVLNFPALYPAVAGRGVSVAGMLAPNTEAPFFEPRALYEELRAELGEYQIDVPWPGGGTEVLPAYCAGLEVLARERTRWAEAILGRVDWNLALITYVTPDRMQHKAWQVLSQLAHGAQPTETGRAALAALTAMDEGVGALVAAVGEETDLLVVSDHGFGPAQEVFEPNVLLAQAGLLERRPASLRLVGWGKKVRRLLGRGVRVGSGAGLGERTTGRVFASLVDWPRTKAFALSVTDMGIYLNLRGRFPRGCVEPGAERLALLTEIETACARARHPRTGEPLVIKTYRREEIFHGPLLEEAPDLLFAVQGGAMHCGTRVDGPLVHPAEFLRGDGNHRREGIFLARGSGVAAGEVREDWEMVDVAPTILARLGLGGGEHMDGNPRLASNPVEI